MNLSTHFTLNEFTDSNTAVRNGIDNKPEIESVSNLQQLCVHVLENVRSMFGDKPIRVSSGYRCKKLNTLIGGSPTSDHMTGQAVDFTVDGVSVTDVVNSIKSSDIQFDQLIHEFDRWVHVSYKKNGNRREVLRAVKKGKITVYEKYI